MLPDTFPRVPDDFPGPMLYEVAPEHRFSRGRFWRPNHRGYTDSPGKAGIYFGPVYADTSYAIDAQAVLACLTAEADALRGSLEGLDVVAKETA